MERRQQLYTFSLKRLRKADILKAQIHGWGNFVSVLVNTK